MKERLDLAVLSLLFFTWGFVTCLNDILIPHLKAAFELTYFQAALIQFTFFLAYFVLALPAGKVINKIGYKRTMITGLVIAAVGSVGFVPAAQTHSYATFLIALFTLASGITLLQVSANPYVIAVGAESKSASRLNLVQAFNSLGTTVAPLIGGYLILSKSSGVDSVIVPYVLLAVLLLSLALMFYMYKLPTLPNVEGAVEKPRISEILHYRHVTLGALAIFIYVGGEVSIGSFLVNYLSEPDMLAMGHEEVAKYVSIYWGGAMVGRFIGAVILRQVSTGTLLGIFSVTAALLVLVSMFSVGSLSVVTILAVGLFNSIMFPSIFSLGVAQLGKLTSAGSALLVMAIVGGAIIPLIVGVFADMIGLRYAFIIPVFCYVYLFYYGFYGSIVKKWPHPLS